MKTVVGLKFKDGGKLYYFSPAPKAEYKRNMHVIVETAKGLECATVVYPSLDVEDDKIVSPLKPVIRIANERDEEQIRRNEERRPEAMRLCKEKIAAHGLNMKLVDCEFTFDGSKVLFFFTADSRVDFRELVKDLASVFHMRIELRQIGIRDETKLLGGIAPCGRPCCCASCMPDFKKVSIKMAKTQGLSLNPSKISGLCGRLMCCLEYENDYYAEACKKVPKVGSEVTSPDGKGTVISVNMLKMEAKIKIPVGESDFIYRDYSVDKLKFTRTACPCGKGKDRDDDDDVSDELKNLE